MKLRKFYTIVIPIISILACGRIPQTPVAFPTTHEIEPTITNEPSVPTTESVFSKRIVFMSDRSEGQEIYVMRVNGEGITRLTNNTWSDRSPSVSPNGEIILYRSDPDRNYASKLMVQPLAGGPASILPISGTLSDDTLLFSPDGNQLLFSGSANENQDMRIFSMLLNGGGQWTLLSPDDSNISGDITPEWSPDGRRILFSRCFRDTKNCDLMVMNMDGTNLQNITNTPDVCECCASWSPDGKRIAYRRDISELHNLYIMNSDGSNQTPMIAMDIGMIFVTHPAWSPDGQYILMELKIPDQSFDIILLSSNAALTTWFDVTDCNQIAFREGRCAALRLTDSPGYDGMPAWVP